MRAKSVSEMRKKLLVLLEQLSHRPKNRLIKKVLRCFCFPYHELSQLTKAFMIIVVWCLINLSDLVTLFHNANNMDPDQTAPKGSKCLLSWKSIVECI